MIPLFKVHLPPKDELMPALEQVLYSGYITQGPKVDRFEQKLSRVLKNRYVLAVNSGTSALQLALRLSNVRGRDVVTTPMTCSATVLPVLAEGATPVWADIDPDSGNLDPADVERKITPDTGAILAVHWGGQPCNMGWLSQIARDHNIPLIVDAAHALGASWNGEPVGSTDSGADFTCFSLQAIKHITTGDGGILTVKREADYERGKRLRWFGLDRTANSGDARVDNDISEWGYKFHMNDIAATIGLAQLPYLTGILNMQRLNAAEYDEALFLLPNVRRQKYLLGTVGAWWLYTVLLDSSAERDAFMQFMLSHGVQVSRVHSRLDRLSAFSGFSKGDLPGVSSFFERECAIPVHWGLSLEEVNQIISLVLEFCEAK